MTSNRLTEEEGVYLIPEIVVPSNMSNEEFVKHIEELGPEEVEKRYPDIKYMKGSDGTQ